MVMLVKTVVKESSIDGIGVFADEDIAKGTVVWRYLEPVDQSFTTELVETLPPLVQAFVKKYAYFFEQTGKYILCGDHGRFMNHAETPNTAGEGIEGLEEGEDVALRDIKRGEELTCDYMTFDQETASKLAPSK